MKPEERGSRKTKTGTVLSNKMKNTVVVAVERTMQHPRYGKVIRRSKKLYAENRRDDLQVGDKVTVMETRPLSKLKRWLVVDKLEGESLKEKP